MRKTIQIVNRQSFIELLKEIDTIQIETDSSIIQTIIYHYEGVMVMRITVTKKGENESSEIWMVEDTSYTWDEFAAIVKRNSRQI